MCGHGILECQGAWNLATGLLGCGKCLQCSGGSRAYQLFFDLVVKLGPEMPEVSGVLS